CRGPLKFSRTQIAAPRGGSSWIRVLGVQFVCGSIFRTGNELRAITSPGLVSPDSRCLVTCHPRGRRAVNRAFGTSLPPRSEWTGAETNPEPPPSPLAEPHPTTAAAAAAETSGI